MHRLAFLAGAAIWGTVFAWQPASGQVDYSLVVDNDAFNGTVSTALLDENGEVAVLANIGGTGSVLVFSGGTLSTLVGHNTPVPGYDDERFLDTGDLLQTPDGNRFFLAGIVSPFGSPTPEKFTFGLFKQSTGGPLALLMDAREFAAPLGLDPAQVFIGEPNPFEVIAFSAPAAGAVYVTAEKRGVASGLFVVDAGGTPTLLLEEGTNLPGIDGATVARITATTATNTGQEISRGRFAVNASGKAIGVFRLEGAGVTTANDEAVALISGGTVTVLAREGDPVPGGGGSYGSFLSVRVNAGGNLVFADTTRIYIGTGAGDLTVAITNGVDTASHNGRVAIADDGVIFFLSMGNSLTLFKLEDGQIQTLATRNDEIPGTGLVLDRFLGGDIVTSTDGKIVARVRLILGGDVTAANDDALLALDGKGKMALLAREGTPILIPDGMGGETAFEVTGLVTTSINTKSQFMIVTGSGHFIATVDDFLATGPEFIWSGDCGNRNWHSVCGGPATNWVDENGIARASPPGTGGDEMVRIVGADVEVTDAAVSIGSLDARSSFFSVTNSLRVTTALSVNEASSIENLSLEGDLTANGAVALSGLGNRWRSGAIGGLARVTLGAGSELRIEPSGIVGSLVELKTLLNVEGIVHHGEETLILGTDSGQIEVLPGGEYRFEAGGIDDDTGGDGSIILDGTLRKTTDSAVILGVPVISVSSPDAALAVEGGSLTLTGGGFYQGTHTVANGASLILKDAPMVAIADLAVSGDGTVRIEAGTNEYEVNAGTTAVFNLAPVGDGLQVTGRTITADGLLENKGRALFDGAVLGGTIPEGGFTNRGVLIFSGVSSELAAPLRNEAGSVVIQEENVQIPSGQGDGLITNRGTYVIGADGDAHFTDLNTFATNRFANEENGTLRKVGAGFSQIFAGVENQGDIVVEDGTLELVKTISTAPTGNILGITAGAGASLVFASSPGGSLVDHRLDGDFNFLGTGTVRFEEDTALEITGTLTNKGMIMEVKGNSIICNTTLSAGGGTAGILNESGTLRIDVAESILRLGAVDLTNRLGAEVIQSRGVSIESESPPISFHNQGVWTVRPSAFGPLQILSRGSSERFINSGMLIIEGNPDSTTTFSDTEFLATSPLGTHTGTVEVLEDGRLFITRPHALVTFSDGTLWGGNWIVNPDSEISLSDGIFVIARNASVTIRGNPADANVEDGQIANLPIVEGDFTNYGGLRLEGAIFRSTGGFTNERYGSVRLNPGILNIEGLAGLRNMGRISGVGTVNGEVINNGVFDFGSSPGAITVNGDYTQGAEGTLSLEEQGGDSFGPSSARTVTGSRALGEGGPLLVVTGVARLGGTLRLGIGGGFELPAPGSGGVLIQAGTFEGTFDWIDQHEMGRQVRYNIEITGTEMTATAEAVSIQTYADWRALEFPESQAGDDHVSGPFADPEKDGLENFTEYVHGTHPLLPSQHPVSATVAVDTVDTVSTEVVYRLEFPWDDNLVDAAWRLQISPDLADWTDVEGTLVSIEESGDFTVRSLEYRSVMPTGGKGFVRLVAAPVPDEGG